MEIFVVAIIILLLFFLNKFLNDKFGNQKKFIWSKAFIIICLLIYLGYRAFTNDSNKQLFFCMFLAIILISTFGSKK